MIQTESVLLVADNSWAKVLKCIKVLGWSKKRYARVWDIIKCSVKDANPQWGIKKKSIVRAVVVRTSAWVHRNDWTYVRTDLNAAVVVDDKNEPKATRIFWPVFRELRQAWFQKIISLAPQVI